MLIKKKTKRSFFFYMLILMSYDWIRYFNFEEKKNEPTTHNERDNDKQNTSIEKVLCSMEKKVALFWSRRAFLSLFLALYSLKIYLLCWYSRQLAIQLSYCRLKSKHAKERERMNKNQQNQIGTLIVCVCVWCYTSVCVTRYIANVSPFFLLKQILYAFLQQW